MGWGTGTNAQGRPIGYSVIALCDTKGCLAPIDRGLAYVCGGMHDGGEHGCGGYFCGEHLLMGYSLDEETSYGQICASCQDDLDATEREHQHDAAGGGTRRGDADSSRSEGQEDVVTAKPVVRDSHHRIGHLGPSRQDWRTPRWLFDQLNAEFQFCLDAAASADNTLCSLFIPEEQDALSLPWAPHATWVNPPYRRLGPWVRKAFDESRHGATVVMLLPASTDTRWFHDIIQPHAEVRFLRGRLKFEGAQHPATFASMVVIFRPWQVQV